MSVGCIYRWVSVVTGKTYIGQTSRNPYHRWQEHEYDAFIKKSTNHFHSAIRKYGRDAWIVGVIVDNVPIDKLDYYEKLLITTYNSVEEGYNSDYGGISYRMSEKTRKKLSEAHSGSKHKNWGKHLSEDTRKKISESNKGRKNSEEVRRKIGEGNRGKIMSLEARQKISATLKRKGHTKGISNKSFKPWWYEKDGAKVVVTDMTIRDFEDANGINRGTLTIRFNKKHIGKLVTQGRFKGMRFGYVGETYEY